jgi:Domain of unknown function (DUF4382)
MPLEILIKSLTAVAVLTWAMVALPGCSCGFDCSNGNNGNNDNSKTSLSLGFSDESVEQLKQVVIEVSSITFRRNGAEDVVVDTFTIEELGLVAADSFQIDLLQYQGLRQLQVITALELDPGSYSELLITIMADDINHSYVQESDDSLKPITVAAGGLALSGPSLASGSQLYTVAFSLAQALHFRTGSDDYELTTQGIRLADNAVAASVSGRVARDLFDSVSPCDEKTDPLAGNRLYLYRGKSLPAEQLADVFTDNSATETPANALAPYAVPSLVQDVLSGGWQYAAGFLPAGDYSLAFSCDTEGDDPVDFDGFVIPLPTAQHYDIELTAGEQAICDLAEGATCS